MQHMYIHQEASFDMYDFTLCWLVLVLPGQRPVRDGDMRFYEIGLHLARWKEAA